MPVYLIEGAYVRDVDTGEANQALVGVAITVVIRDTTTPAPILDSGTLDPIVGSQLTVTSAFTLPPFRIDAETPEDLYLDWYDAASGFSGPIGFEAVMREVAVEARDSAAASRTAAEDAQTAAEDAQTAAETAQTDAATLAASAVRTVNHLPPDASGNVNVEGGGGGGGGTDLVLAAGDPVPAGTPSDTVIFRREPAPAALEVVEQSVGTFADSTSSVSLPVPANTATGDLLVVAIASQNSGTVWTPPGGWQTLASHTTGDARSMFVFALPVTGTPPAGSAGFVGDGGVGRVCATIFRVTGADLDTPLLVAGAQSSRVEEVVTVPELVGSAGGLVLSVVGVNVGGGSPLTQPMTWNNGMSPFTSVTTGTDDAVSRTTLDLAWQTTVPDFPEHDITAAAAVSAMAGFAVAIRGAS